MKRRLAIVLLFCVLGFGWTMVAQGHAHAFNPFETACKDTDNQQQSSVCSSTGENPISGPNGIVLKIAQLLLILVGVGAVIMIMLGGLQYILSVGDPSKINNAKNTILYAIIGLVVAVLAQVIITFVIRRL